VTAPAVKPSAAVASASAAPSAPLGDLPEGPGVLSPAQADRLVARGTLRVELVSAGAVPREALRVVFEGSGREELRLRAVVKLAVSLAGDKSEQPVPGMVLSLAAEARVGDGGRGGELWVIIQELVLEPQGAAEKAVAAEMQPHLAKLAGVDCQMPIGSRGRTGPPSVPPEAAAGPTAQLWSTVGEALRELAVPLPAEPVGRGAEWHVFERLHRAGIEMLRRTRYQLLGREGGKVKLSGRIRELPIAGGSRDPAAPEGVTIDPQRGETVGEHRLTRPLFGGVVPTESESKLESRLVTETRHELAKDGPVTAEVVLTQTLRLTHAPKPPSKGPANDGR
jgi:hypothetical protein